MTTRKEQKAKAQPPEQRDDLALDAETVKDLEPHEKAGRVRGGGPKSRDAACSDVRLKESVKTLTGALARLRLLRIG